MPLPKITVAKFPVTIPSSKKKTFFRPFLMKEQKILYMALQSEDIEHMFNAICEIIENCVDGIENTADMPIFDLEYLFMKIRAKSVGEIINVGVKCGNCNKSSKVEVNLETIEVEFPEQISNKIMLTDKMGIIIRYPCMKDAKKRITEMDANTLIDFFCESIESVFDETSVWTKKDFTQDELKQFVESMNPTQVDSLVKFYTNIPELSKKIEFTCNHCQHEQTIDFRRLQDFFT